MIDPTGMAAASPQTAEAVARLLEALAGVVRAIGTPAPAPTPAAQIAARPEPTAIPADPIVTDPEEPNGKPDATEPAKITEANLTEADAAIVAVLSHARTPMSNRDAILRAGYSVGGRANDRIRGLVERGIVVQTDDGLTLVRPPPG